MKRGKVYLIGAGPGDIELLTLKAVRLLQEAEVVLLDDLVNEEILQFIDARANVIGVGKRGGCRSTPQAFIEKQMIRFAKSGKIVARVKGGDPFIFGRGGEEMLALHNAGIEVEIVNGITAGMGVSASLGIPLTHRGWNNGVSFITGHTQNNRKTDWQALLRSNTTLVIYMGMSNLNEIIDGLLEAGISKQMPAAAIQWGTLAKQKQVVSTIDTLLNDVRRANLSSPAIIVIGEVVSLVNLDEQILQAVNSN